MGYGLTQWRRRYQNGPCIIGRSGRILYVTFRNRGLEIVPSAGFLVAFPDNFLRGTSPCRVSYFSTGLSGCTGQVQVLKLVLETEHLRYLVLELFLLVLLWASSIQLKLV